LILNTKAEDTLNRFIIMQVSTLLTYPDWFSQQTSYSGSIYHGSPWTCHAGTL